MQTPRHARTLASGPPRRTNGAARVFGSAAVVTSIALLAACGNGDRTADRATSRPSRSSSGSPRSVSPSATPTPSESVTDAPTASATPITSPAPRTSGVYFVADTRSGLRLTRELRDLPGADPVKEAVQAMISGPQDPDYRSTWNPRTQVRSVDPAGNVVTVDLSPAARKVSVGSEAAERMVQQLVYTVTEAARRPQAKVRLTIGGQPAGDLWGAVSWTDPIGRADPAAVRMLVQISTPREGAATGSPVRVAGEADAFEANVPWQVVDGHGNVVKQGAATALEGMQFSPYSFTVKLPPGTYTVRVAEDDPSAGEGGAPMADTKRITVG
ncbi:MAG: hypothetical protein QOK15_3073 [Nocardioidaceae bacterium]|nr:hypothetical protein [Nocardioidaceae bacterium]